MMLRPILYSPRDKVRHHASWLIIITHANISHQSIRDLQALWARQTMECLRKLSSTQRSGISQTVSIPVIYHATYWVIALSDAYFAPNQLTTLFFRPHSRRRNPSQKFRQAHSILVPRTWSMLSVYIFRQHSNWSVVQLHSLLVYV
jgi:hypothetical protein